MDWYEYLQNEPPKVFLKDLERFRSAMSKAGKLIHTRTLFTGRWKYTWLFSIALVRFRRNFWGTEALSNDNYNSESILAKTKTFKLEFPSINILYNFFFHQALEKLGPITS